MFDLDRIIVRTRRLPEHRRDSAPTAIERAGTARTPGMRPAQLLRLPAVCGVAMALAGSGGAWAESASPHAAVTAEDIGVNLLIFILSTFLGLGLIHGVAKLLHTPLMSLTNAISSVSVVAALIVLSYPENSPLVIVLATVGTALALSNVISGFMITERILKMFRKGGR